MKNIYRVKKGFVFNYNINKDINKFSVPKLSNGAQDYNMYGIRPWIVVSEPQGQDLFVSAVPVGTNSYGHPTEVLINLDGKHDSTVDVAKLNFVNTSELTNFIGIVDDEKMKEIDNALKIHFGFATTNENTITVSQPLKIEGDLVNLYNDVKSGKASTNTLTDSIIDLYQILIDYREMALDDFLLKYNKNTATEANVLKINAISKLKDLGYYINNDDYKAVDHNMTSKDVNTIDTVDIESGNTNKKQKPLDTNTYNKWSKDKALAVMNLYKVNDYDAIRRLFNNLDMTDKQVQDRSRYAKQYLNKLLGDIHG